MGKENYSLIIESENNSHAFLELKRYKDVLYYLAWRDFKVRYKQTIIGVLWAILRPLITMIILVIIFDKLAGLPTDGNTPYAIFVYIATLPWYMFSNSLVQGSNVFVSNRNLITKIYFPRIIMPISNLLVNLVDFLISFMFLFVLMFFYDFIPSWRILLLPLFLLLLISIIISINLWVSALNVKYRDVSYIVPIIIQLGLYISPVGFSSSNIPEEWQLLYSLNPMVGVIDGFRWSIIGADLSLNWNGLFLSFITMFVLLYTGYKYFQRNERYFADII